MHTLIFLGYRRNSNFSVRTDSIFTSTPSSPNDSSLTTKIETLQLDKDWVVKISSVNKEFRMVDMNLAKENAIVAAESVLYFKLLK